MQVQIQSRRIIDIFRPYCRCSLSTTRWIESEYALYVWFYFVSCVFPFPLVWFPFFAFQHAFLSLPPLFLRHLSRRLCLSPRWIYHPPNTTSLRMNLSPIALERGGGLGYISYPLCGEERDAHVVGLDHRPPMPHAIGIAPNGGMEPEDPVAGEDKCRDAWRYPSPYSPVVFIEARANSGPVEVRV